MEKKGIGNITAEPQPLVLTVKRAKDGDKKSMEDVLNYFSDDINYLSRFIMLPKEDAIQELKLELLNIIFEEA
ncbi:MAG: helix-turn-helix domain-containing protein [Bacillota bacterium]|nr:helix-turn-helix domain-containing protein [Bacillota bacterium]